MRAAYLSRRSVVSGRQAGDTFFVPRHLGLFAGHGGEGPGSADGGTAAPLGNSTCPVRARFLAVGLASPCLPLNSP